MVPEQGWADGPATVHGVCGAPTLTASPAQVDVGGSSTLTGQCTGGGTVQFYVDGTRVAQARPDENGDVSVRLSFGQLGKHQVQMRTASAKQAFATVTVVGAGSGDPTEGPTEQPTGSPTEQPTGTPTEEPTEKPTDEPTGTPTETPSEPPTQTPTADPTTAPTTEPTPKPTEEPTTTPDPTEKPAPSPDDDASPSVPPTTGAPGRDGGGTGTSLPTRPGADGGTSRGAEAGARAADRARGLLSPAPGADQRDADLAETGQNLRWPIAIGVIVVVLGIAFAIWGAVARRRSSAADPAQSTEPSEDLTSADDSADDSSNAPEDPTDR